MRAPKIVSSGTDVNAEPRVVASLDGVVVAVIAVGVHRGRIDVIHGIGNPAKLQHLQHLQHRDAAAIRDP